MGDNDQDVANAVDEQGTREAEDRDERPGVAAPRPVDEGQGQPSVSAPADDDIIIK